MLCVRYSHAVCSVLSAVCTWRLLLRGLRGGSLSRNSKKKAISAMVFYKGGLTMVLQGWSHSGVRRCLLRMLWQLNIRRYLSHMPASTTTPSVTPYAVIDLIRRYCPLYIRLLTFVRRYWLPLHRCWPPCAGIDHHTPLVTPCTVNVSLWWYWPSCSVINSMRRY